MGDMYQNWANDNDNDNEKDTHKDKYKDKDRMYKSPYAAQRSDKFISGQTWEICIKTGVKTKIMTETHRWEISKLD